MDICNVHTALKSTNYTDNLVTYTNDIWCFSQEDWVVWVRKPSEEDPHIYLHSFCTLTEAFEFHQGAISSHKCLSFTVHDECSSSAHWFRQRVDEMDQPSS